MKNETELIKIHQATSWHYDKAESVHVRIWSQLVKQNEVTPILIQWISYMVVILIFHCYFEIDIVKTYKLMHNNDPAELQEYMYV